jgi:hypothetical protein
MRPGRRPPADDDGGSSSSSSAVERQLFIVDSDNPDEEDDNDSDAADPNSDEDLQAANEFHEVWHAGQGSDSDEEGVQLRFAGPNRSVVKYLAISKDKKAKQRYQHPDFDDML